MVTVIYKKQLKWFTQKLLELRALEDGYGSSVIFKPTFIIENDTVIGFNTAERSPKEYTIRMLKEIKHTLIKSKNISAEELSELSWIELENGNIEIDGYSTELLRKFFKEFFNETPTSLFGEGRNDEERQVLTYCENITNVTISGNTRAVFNCLRNNFNKDTSFEELNTAIRATRNLLMGPITVTNTHITETERAAVRSAVNDLTSRLKSATGYTNYPEIIESIRGIGYKMVI